MAKRPRTKKQAQSDKTALRKLRDLGIVPAKTDLRKAPSRRQRTLINKIKDVFARVASIVKTKSAAAYKATGRFTVLKDYVIVPRAKGERVKVDKAGAIVKTRSVKGRTVKRTIRVEQPSKIARPVSKATVFVVPFKKKGGGEEYRRFTYDGLKTFFAEYLRNIKQFDEWSQYIEEEEIEFNDTAEREAFEDAHAQIITGYVSLMDDRVKPAKGRKAVKRLRRELREELLDDE
jgi:hypothetical protein